jgi:hypothetical protein
MERGNAQEKKLAAELFPLITAADVDRAYSGRPGCGCGCRGIYRERGRLVSSNMATMQKRLPEVGAQVDEDFVIFFLEDETRYRWLYVNRQRFEKRSRDLIASISQALN